MCEVHGKAKGGVATSRAITRTEFPPAEVAESGRRAVLTQILAGLSLDAHISGMTSKAAPVRTELLSKTVTMAHAG